MEVRRYNVYEELYIITKNEDITSYIISTRIFLIIPAGKKSVLSHLYSSTTATLSLQWIEEYSVTGRRVLVEVLWRLFFPWEIIGELSTSIFKTYRGHISMTNVKYLIHWVYGSHTM